MTKFIIWISPENKKLQYRNFWTESETMQGAIENLKNTADFKYKILGVTGYMNLGQASEDAKLKAFINNSFH